MKIIVLVLLIVSVGFGYYLFTNNPKQVWPEYAGKSVYFETWTGYFEYPIPIKEISIQKAKLISAEGHAYYEATFNTDGKMTIWKKYINDTVEFEKKWSHQ